MANCGKKTIYHHSGTLKEELPYPKGHQMWYNTFDAIIGIPMFKTSIKDGNAYNSSTGEKRMLTTLAQKI